MDKAGDMEWAKEEYTVHQGLLTVIETHCTRATCDNHTWLPLPLETLLQAISTLSVILPSEWSATLLLRLFFCPTLRVLSFDSDNSFAFGRFNLWTNSFIGFEFLMWCFSQFATWNRSTFLAKVVILVAGTAFFGIHSKTLPFELISCLRTEDFRTWIFFGTLEGNLGYFRLSSTWWPGH